MAICDPDQARAAETGAKAMMPIAGPMRDAAGSFVRARSAGRSSTTSCPRSPTPATPTSASSSRPITRRWRATTRGAGTPRRLRLAFAVQDEPIGTANAVAAAEAWTGDDPFLVINGDNYYAVRTLASLVGRAGAATALYRAETLVARSNIPADRIRAFALGVVEDGRLARIVEKPTPEQAAALGDRRSSA